MKNKIILAILALSTSPFLADASSQSIKSATIVKVSPHTPATKSTALSRHYSLKMLQLAE